MTRGLPDAPLVAWLGDDFTGSAATLEVLAFAGLEAALFLDIPNEAQLARFPGLRALGIATTARAHGPDWMEAHLPAFYGWLKGFGAQITHYKTCSTLDSAPHVGSIGKAADLAWPFFGGWTPCLVAAPAIRRYQAFGHLFAAAPDGMHRLDRHPVMARHPVTPMTESDVARHLAYQTGRRFGLVDLEALHGDADARLAEVLANGAEIVTLDTVSTEDLARVGRLIWEHRADARFAIGSQGVEYALVAHWQAAGLIAPQKHAPSAGAVDRMIGVSGSVSPVTASQIDWAAQNGAEVIGLDVADVVTGVPGAEARAADAALQALGAGRDALVVSARGPEDPAVATMRQAADHARTDTETANARIGQALGRILASVLARTDLRRAVIFGGDTSGHATRQLDIYALSALAPTIPGAALMRAHSDTARFDGLELALKGGQMGSPDFFGWIKRGGGAAGQTEQGDRT